MVVFEGRARLERQILGLSLAGEETVFLSHNYTFTLYRKNIIKYYLSKDTTTQICFRW